MEKIIYLFLITDSPKKTLNGEKNLKNSQMRTGYVQWIRGYWLWEIRKDNEGERESGIEWLEL